MGRPRRFEDCLCYCGYLITGIDLCDVVPAGGQPCIYCEYSLIRLYSARVQ